LEVKRSARSIENATTGPTCTRTGNREARIAGLVIGNRAVKYIRDTAIVDAATVKDAVIPAHRAVDQRQCAAVPDAAAYGAKVPADRAVY
jgi:hypothetical protein